MGVRSLVVSSTLSKRLFEGDLVGGKGMESCILTTREEFVVVKISSLLRGYAQPTLLVQKHRSLDRVPHRIQFVFDQTLTSVCVENYEEKEEETLLR